MSFYETECEHCHWRGSSEDLHLHRYEAGDSEVECPACNRLTVADEVEPSAGVRVNDWCHLDGCQSCRHRAGGTGWHGRPLSAEEARDAMRAIAPTCRVDRIVTWPFCVAPEALRCLSENGGDEDWISVRHASISYVSWMEEGSRYGCCSVDEIVVDEWIVTIGSHA